MYNSAGRFSTPLKTFSSRRVFRPSIEQGASPPVLWSRGCLFSPVALASAVISKSDDDHYVADRTVVDLSVLIRSLAVSLYICSEKMYRLQ